jgi:hypothetical protein
MTLSKLMPTLLLREKCTQKAQQLLYCFFARFFISQQPNSMCLEVLSDLVD